ncbi:TonB-dependent receptor [Flavobacterium sp.]|uniref:SusC/RagA family TonB-linked outer membrane protein n=1 Tax=Flavobacterium sp. TaxID=239 RepID=UPI0025F13497|nr:TonB-dependent receptor [Flavobacterium sp.]
MHAERKIKFKKLGFVNKYLLVSILLFGISVSAQNQNKTINGVVTDESSIPLVGVTVKVKGLKVGTLTDKEGKFVIQANPTNSLVFSYIGFEDKSIAVNNKKVINVVMQSLTTSLEEVVVVGYGTQKKSDVTGSVGKISVKDMLRAPVRSFDEALAGRVSGVQVTSSDGQPGAGINIVIRGNNSVTQGNSPLYVVDGFLMENPNNGIINPKDIESIDVLKDASATAIYGARGANGVIVITTKKGKTGAPVYSFDTSYGFQQTISKMDLMSPYEFVKYQLELDPTLVSSTGFKSPAQIFLTDGKTLDYYKDAQSIDWQDKVTRTAAMKNVDFSVRGGNKATKYAFSTSFIDQDGILINSDYKRYQGRLVLDHNITDNLKIGVNTNFSQLERTGISPAASTGSATTNIMVSVWGYKPVNGSTSNEDSLIDLDIDPANDYRVNPLLNLNNLYRFTETQSLNTNAYLEYTIVPSLKLRVSNGIIENRVKSESFNNTNTYYGRPGNNNGINGSVSYSQSSNWLNENTLTWKPKLSKKHTLDVLGGFTIQKQTSKSYGSSANQIPVEYESLGIASLDKGVALRVDTFQSVWTMASFLSRVNYNFNSKYFLTASMRADGSSKFPSENHWGYFPSGALSWKFKNEKLLKSSKILSDGKIRASYGQTGNNRVGDFDYLTTYYNPIGNSYVFNNQYVEGVVPLTLGNSKLKWETTEQVDLGLDLGFFKQRITLEADVYRKTTKDLLLRADLPLSSGFSTALKNVGAIQNRGLELTVNTKNIQTKDFSWSTSFNIAFNQSKVVALADNQEDIQSSINWDNKWSSTPAYITKIGQPLGLMYGYESLGTYKYADFNITRIADGSIVDPTAVDPAQYASYNFVLKADVATNGNIRANIKPGDIKYKDQNGDLFVNSSDYTVIGRGLPKHIGGFTNNFTYKGFDLNVFFQWSYGNDILNANRILFDGNSVNNMLLNQFSSYENRWSPTNPTSDVFRTKGFYTGGYSSRYVEDGSFLRLKTISLGYNFDSKWVQKMNIKSIRLYVSGQNLFTWTKYSGPDPEVNVYNTALTSGFDFSAYPRARTFTFGTNINF